MSRLIISVEGTAGKPDAVARLDGTETAWRCSLPDYDAATAASLRWVLEDYPRLMASESRRVAAILAHAKLFAFGAVLHDAVFGEEGSRLRQLPVPLPELEFAIVDPAGLTRHWPWELMNWDGAALVHNGRSFLRSVEPSAQATSTSRLSRTGTLRVLMVIARPSGVSDIPFRTVASGVLRAVAGKHVDIEVLRPSTLQSLERRLVEARRNGEPFDVVHFDGHGGLKNTRGGTLGVLLFEGHADRWAIGARMAQALAAGGVPLLLLNACQSAQAPVDTPRTEDPAGSTPGVMATASLAEEVAATGIEVVAMSHAVHAPTAAHIVTDIYAMLAVHRDVADAVRFARLRWRDDTPALDVAEGYAIVRHFGRLVERRGPPPSLDYPDMRPRPTPAHPRLPSEFQSSDVIVGTDDAVFTLERRLRRGGLVELRGLRGSGKTALLLEFGRWLVATRGARPEAVHYVDLAREPVAPVPQVEDGNRQVVLFDNARVVHGDPLRGVAGWDYARLASLRRSIDELIDGGAHVIVATCAPFLDVDVEQRMPMLPLELEPLREIAATLTRGEVTVPDFALLWTGGNPGSVDVMVDWARGGYLSGPEKTWQALRELGLGAFARAQLPVRADAPIAVSAPAAMFEPAFLSPWVVAQFATRMILDPHLIKAISEASFMSPLRDATAPGALVKFEQAGLVCRTDEHSYDVHPLASCIIPSPVTSARTSTEQHWANFNFVAQFVAQAKALQFGREGGAYLRQVRDQIDSPWWLPTLIQSWRYMGEMSRHHGLYLSLARRIRDRLLDVESGEYRKLAGFGDYWNLAFADMQKTFEESPPDSSPEGHQARLQWISLQTLEAKRAGDSSREIALAQEAAERSAADGTEIVDAFDAQMKLGRAEREPERKRMAFERAIELAAKDELRVGVAELELTRILRTELRIRDLARARDYGESALGRFRFLLDSGLADPTRVVESALSLSLVYLDLVQEGHDESGEAARRGEALCRESLNLATVGFHKANAAYNLGIWRLLRGDPAEAEQLLLKALSAYDALGESEHLQNKARYFRLKAIRSLPNKVGERALEAQLLAADLLPRLLADPEAPDAWKVDTYQIGKSLGAATQPPSGATETAHEPDVAQKAAVRVQSTRELAQREPSGSLPEERLSSAEFAELLALAEQGHVNGDLDDARAILHGLIVLDRRSVPAWALLGRVERDAGLLEDARAAFAFALGLEPGSAELATELARVGPAGIG